MNRKIDLTRHRDFSRLNFVSLKRNFYPDSDKPWSEELFKNEFGEDGRVRPWAKAEFEEAQEVFCYRCGKRLTDDLPWYRKKHDLCYECRQIISNNDKKDWLFGITNGEPMENKYVNVFLTEYIDERRGFNG